MRHAQSRRAPVLAAGGCLLLTTAAGAQVIDFEDLPTGTVVTTQYGSRGAVFPNGAALETDPAARSGTRVLRAGRLVREFHPGPFRIELTRERVRRVRVFAGLSLSTTPIMGTLRAFNAAGAPVAQDGPKSVAPGGLATMFEVTASPPVLARVELQMDGDEFEAIDDLEIEASGGTTLPQEAPIVAFSSPPDGSETDVSSLTVQGTVTGDGLFPTAVLSWQVPLPPGITLPTQTARIPLTPAGAASSFSFTWTAAPLGPITVSLEAENSAGLKGTGTLRLRNLPVAIRTRYASENGAATLGQFRFGIHGAPECRLVVYERGAISAEGAVTRVMKERITTKWLGIRNPNGYPGELGCPTGEQRPNPEDTQVQDFHRGRIYARPAAAFYVPSVFALAIDRNGGERATGVPLEDPAEPLGVLETWLFQRFRAYGEAPNAHTATLEIRGPGQAPKLYLERLKHEHAATDVAVFSCEQTVGPCQVDRPLMEPALTEAIDRAERPVSQSTLAELCKNTNWEDEGWPAVERLMTAKLLGQPIFTQALAELAYLTVKLPPEWPPIETHFTQTGLKGVVKDGHRARVDNPFTHSYPGLDCISAAAISGIHSWIADHYPPEESGGGPTFCASDYDLYVIPRRGWRHVLGGADPMRPLIGARDDVPVEWEDDPRHTNYRATTLFDPLPGDLVFTSGRWIVDCGHTWKTEIHPPSVLAWMRQSQYQDHQATVAYVWVTGWYAGAYPVEFLVHPPPRPSPRATLVSVGEAVGASEITPDRIVRTDVTVTTVTGTNEIRLRVTAPWRQPEVTEGFELVPWVSQGNMKWLEDPGRASAREFEGRYWVYWSDPTRALPPPAPLPRPSPR